MLAFTRNLFVGGAFALLVVGCNVDARRQWRQTSKDPAVKSNTRSAQAGNVDIRTVSQREVDLVEAVAAHREEYRRSLETLHNYYDQSGYHTKRSWAAQELAGLRSVKQFAYLLDAEVPSGNLRAMDSISEADALFQNGVELMRAGGHGVPGIYRQDRMIEAAAVFRQLIQQFPTSDKIDDAAFLCGEIHKEYLRGQESIAVKWYERAWTWDPQTPHPARFQAALVYDYRLQDRARALELYHYVVGDPSSSPVNVRFAARRIDELTDGEAAIRAAQR
jgi:TolA-binding protein